MHHFVVSCTDDQSTCLVISIKMAMKFPLWGSSSDSNYSSSYDSSSSGDDATDHPNGSKLDFSYSDLDSELLEANLQDYADSEERYYWRSTTS